MARSRRRQIVLSGEDRERLVGIRTGGALHVSDQIRVLNNTPKAKF